MGAETGIAWTDHTFNPWWGCQRVSPGCTNCYAESWDRRFGESHWGPSAERKLFGDKHWNEPPKWDRAAAAAGVRARVFCASMADVFEDRRDLDEPRKRLWKLIAATPHLDWQLLTKRPENMTRLAPASWAAGWPSNVWAGTTVEDQQRAEERIPHLLSVPAAVRFLSCEPLLGPVDLTRVRHSIDWVIIGGESGPGARPFNVSWARSLLKQCKEAGTACFVKQLGANVRTRNDDGLAGGGEGDWNLNDPEAQVRELDTGYQGAPVRVLLGKKGGDMAEWPEDLRVREFPEVPRG